MIASTTSAPAHLYLRTDLLKLGDVILMYSDSLVSAGIAAATEGEFSHAALAISGLQVYESTLKNGVGFTTLKSAGWATFRGQSVLLGTLIQNPVYCKVLRHPALAEMTEEELDGALKGYYEVTHGWKYSPLQRMEALIRGNLSPLSSLLKALAGRIDRKNNDPLSRYFCSEVVACFFDGLKIPLFRDGRTPDQVRPSDLVSEECCLVEVPGMVIGASEVVFEPMIASGFDIDDVTMNEAMDIQHQNLNSAARLHQTIAGNNRELEAINEDVRLKLKRHCLQHIEKLPDSFGKFCDLANQAIGMLDPALGRRALEYTKRVGLMSVQLVNEGDLASATDQQIASVVERLKQESSSRLRMRALLWCGIFRAAARLDPENESLRTEVLKGRKQTISMARKALLDFRKGIKQAGGVARA